ncbi:carboxyl-terminal-processing peptidase 2, chloroplastic isoform X2 [Zea mays]|uniref:carboxyl-terminal-processing peptidase 2, chloroplastic isoform X2 n=1 Tax=Zea mays TaxID=4577 RepID=UPI0009AA03E4|nr:carboxyl-terminal-processing peptidase 2, chloroplastic isoform X2 [Zea mays]|eukprot:XP_020394331.1 carboxyl-terminal-processing peptidase 2, chloroplastic isoform X2 [Zea mays]
MATCSRPLFVSDSAASASPSRASFRRLRTVAVVSIWEPLPHPPLRAAACRFARTKQCSRRSTECLASGPSVSRLTRPIRRMLSRYSSLMVTLHGNLSRCYKAMSALRPDGVSRHFMSAGGFERVVLGVVLVMSISGASYTAPSSSALTEENLLFLEAWRAVDRAYYDKSFNGQSWFRYRENALRNEPMNTREETYAAIKKMLSTLDDPFTRFLEPEKLKSLRSGTQGALTGVGLSIGYPMAINGSPSGVAVMTATPGGPAEKAGILPGDTILAIDNRSTEDMDIYDAAERLQRQTVNLNPVRSRMCEIPGSKDSSKIGYIKLTTFNQNAAESVKEAIKTLRDNNVKSFVLDLRNNSGGLFPEGIQIAKIWMDKGVIVYICDSQGVRDIYEADGADTIAASEPLVVLVNKGTASASEILAGALKDNKRAVVYGEPTYGKGKIQSVFGLSDGSGLAVTVARYETPAHTDIDKVGVIPDRPLPASFPTDEDAFCSCLRDSTAACNLNAAQLFAKS